MIVTVDTDTAKAVLNLNSGFKRLPFIAVKAINNTALQVQTDVRAHIRGTFAIRKDFVIRQVKYFGASFSTTGTSRWEARVGIGIGKGLDKGGKFLLPSYETGGTHTPGPGRKTVPVPIGARPSKPEPILPQFTFKGMNLKAYRGLKKVRRPGRRRNLERGFGTTGSPLPDFKLTGVQFKGQGGTFLVKEPSGRMLIFQRTGGLVRLIWSLIPSVKLDNRLKFYETAKRTITKTFAPELARLVRDAFGRASK